MKNQHIFTPMSPNHLANTWPIQAINTVSSASITVAEETNDFTQSSRNYTYILNKLKTSKIPTETDVNVSFITKTSYTTIGTTITASNSTFKHVVNNLFTSTLPDKQNKNCILDKISKNATT